MRTWLLEEAPRWRRLLLLIVCGGIPLLFLRNLSDPINVPKLGVLIAGVSIVASIRAAEVLQTKDVRGLRLLWVPATALAAPLVIGWLFSPYKGWAVWGVYPRLLGLLPYLFVILFGVLLADAFRGDAVPVAWALTTAGGIAGAYATIQFLGLDPFEWSVKGTEASGLVVSTLGNPNFAGAFFAIVLPIAVTLFLLRPDRRPVAGVATILIVVGWVAAGSEAAWAGGFGGLVVVVGFFLRGRWRFARIAAAWAVGAIVVVVVGSVLVGMTDRGESRIPATIQRRGDWWEAASSMAADSPLVGRGPNAFALEHSLYRTPEDVRQVGLDITDDPHSVFLSFLTGAGVFGALGYLVAVAWVIRSAWGSSVEGFLAGGFLAGLTAYFIQSLVSIDTVALRVAGWTALAAFVAAKAPGVAVAAKSNSKKKRAAREPLRGLPVLAILVIAALGGVWLGASLISRDAALRHASNLLADGEGQAALEEYEKAVSFPGNVYYRRIYGNVLGRVAVAAGDVDGQPFIEQARESFSFVHHLPQVHAAFDYADTLKEWAAVEPDAKDEAADAYVLAASYDPIDSLALAKAASGLLELEANERVVTFLEPIVSSREDAELWGQLALAQARLGDVVAAEDSLARALALDPSQPAALQAEAVLEESSSGS